MLCNEIVVKIKGQNCKLAAFQINVSQLYNKLIFCHNTDKVANTEIRRTLVILTCNILIERMKFKFGENTFWPTVKN